MRNTRSKKPRRSLKPPRVRLVPLWYKVVKGKRKRAGKAIISSEQILHSNDRKQSRIKSYWGDRLIGLILKENTGLRVISFEDQLDSSILPFNYSVFYEPGTLSNIYEPGTLSNILSDRTAQTKYIVIDYDDVWVGFAYGVKCGK
jgi:hypothetical protein